MKINTKKIADGQLIGHTLWVCQYNRPDLNKKPIRSVPPAKVLVRSAADVPDERVYHSRCFFSELLKDGRPKKRVKQLFDITGNREHAGTPLNCFDNEEECNECWNAEISEVAARIRKKADVAREEWVAEAVSVTSKMVGI